MPRHIIGLGPASMPQILLGTHASVVMPEEKIESVAGLIRPGGKHIHWWLA